MKPVHLDPRARAEYVRAVVMYKAEGFVRAEDFAREARAALEFISRFPDASPADRYGVRAKTVRRFPYTIFYQVLDDVIEVAAFAHQRQQPGHWRARLK